MINQEALDLLQSWIDAPELDKEEAKLGLSILNDLLCAERQEYAEENEYKNLTALKEIDEMERIRMYEGCPDCYSDSLGCSRETGCQQFKQRTNIQQVIDKALGT